MHINSSISLIYKEHYILYKYYLYCIFYLRIHIKLYFRLKEFNISENMHEIHYHFKELHIAEKVSKEFNNTHT